LKIYIKSFNLHINQEVYMSGSIPAISSNPLGHAGLDPYVNPPFINAQRAPTTNDVQLADTTWQDNSVNPPVLYVTTGAGVWYDIGANSGTFTTLSVTGASSLATTSGNVAVANGTAAQIVSIGTGAGAKTVSLGSTNTTSSTTINAGSGGIALNGGVTCSGDVILNGAATQIQIQGGAATDFIGTATLVAGTVTVANTNIAAGDRITIDRNALNASPALGFLVYTITPGVGFAVDSYDATGAPLATDVSGFSYIITRQI
jgi:hypothetical protein